MSTRLDKQIEEDAEYLAGAWPLLVLLGIPGAAGQSARPRPQRREPSEQAKERAAELQAAEAAEDRKAAKQPGYIRRPAPGRHPVPANVTLLDLMADLVRVASDVAETVTQCAGVERLEQPASCWQDPRPYLARARAWIEVADDADDRTRPWVAEQLHDLAHRVADHLGEFHHGYVLDAICPWCLGRTPKRPTGGDRTLVVKISSAGAEHVLGAYAPIPKEEVLIVCHGLNCTPPESAVSWWTGREDRRHPAWPQREWEWLAPRLLARPDRAGA